MTYETRDWSAWFDQMPLGEPTLHVKGTVEFPTSGHQAKLVKPDDAEQDGALVLKVEVEEPEGFVQQVITPREVEYQETGSDLERFDRVRILMADVEIPIQDVS